MESYINLVKGAEDEIIEKKSRFIGQIMPVTSEEEAYAFIDSIKKKHYDARHNCFAFSIGGENPLQRFSDDGEPQGTAGKPILEVINGSGIHNICIVVTRYFGGILLGTGGLVRAYSLATTTALDSATIIKQEEGLEAEFFVDYKELEEVKYHLKNRGIVISNLEYAEKVRLIVEGEKNCIYKLQKDKLSDRVTLEDVKIIGKRNIEVK